MSKLSSETICQIEITAVPPYLRETGAKMLPTQQGPKSTGSQDP